MALYVKLPKYCKTMTREELHQFFPPGMETKIQGWCVCLLVGVVVNCFQFLYL